LLSALGEAVESIVDEEQVEFLEKAPEIMCAEQRSG
jgi:hypothetical protein